MWYGLFIYNKSTIFYWEYGNLVVLVFYDFYVKIK